MLAAAPEYLMMKTLVFIDANQYLGLFGLVKGKKLLDLIDEQKDKIFVSKQIVDEVLRNKLNRAAIFFSEQLKDIASLQTAIPDHLLGIDTSKLTEYGKTVQAVSDVRKVVKQAANEVLSRLSRSEDEVSKRLAPLFGKALAPTPEQVQLARARREKGNPPGKQSDPLGDQISWEQLLSQCQRLCPDKIWIITADTDFFTKFGNERILNPLLNRDLATACGVQPEIRCYDDLSVGLTDFAKTIGVKPGRIPTPEEGTEIKKEIDLWNAWTTHLSEITLKDILKTQLDKDANQRFLEALFSSVPRTD
jgi:hypothetical protein